MLHGFIDESGSPGVAISGNDYFLVSLVVFSSKEEVQRAERLSMELKKHLELSEDYEFHFSKNSSLSKISFIKILKKLDFKFITVAIKKNNLKSNASYDKIAFLLVERVKKKINGAIKIKMDTNPLLYIALKKRFGSAKFGRIQIRQVKSHTSIGIQIADYVAGLSNKKIRKPFIDNNYKEIANKKL